MLASALAASVAGTSAGLAASPAVPQDTFQRPAQSGWGTASNGMAWSSGAGLSIAGSAGVIAYSGASQFLTLGSVTAADADAVVRFSVASTTDTAGIILRAQPSGDRELARYDGAGGLQVTAKTAAGTTTIARVAFTPTPGGLYWLRFAVQGAGQSLKVWTSGTAEPSAWTWTGSSGVLTGAGQMGLYGWAASNAPVRFDSFSVSPVSAVSPPTAALTVTPSSGPAPLDVTADASASTAGTAPISGYRFDFGDGSAAVTQPGPTAAHRYPTGGAFTVAVTVSGADGGTATATARVTAASGSLAQDTFRRADQGGWGTASNGMAWSSGAGLSISANQGVLAYSGSSQFPTLGSVSSADAGALVRFSVAAAGDTAGLVLRSQPGGYRWLARYDGAGGIQVQVKTSAGQTTAGRVAFTPTPGSPYWLRFEVQGSTQSVKVWPSGTVEPAAWTWTGSSTLLPGAGQVGLYGWAAASSPVRFDYFSVVPPGTQHPAPDAAVVGAVSDGATALPIAGATVTLNTGVTALTDPSGSFSFSGLYPDTPYTMTAAASGYVAGSAAATAVAGATARTTISLGPSGGSTTGGLVVSTQVQTAITTNPNNGKTETDVTWTDASGNGWRVGVIPGYGGANIAPWYEVDGGVAGPSQIALSTSNPGDLVHDFTQSPSGAYWGSESTPYAQMARGPIAPGFRAGFRATVPESGADPNGFVHSVTTYVYPGDPGFLVHRFDITNPSGFAIPLASADSIEYDVISGLEQTDATWTVAGGGYGDIGGQPVSGWPTAPVPGDPDYFYLLPAAGSGVRDGVVAVLATKLSTLGLVNPQVEADTNLNRLKVKVSGSGSTFPAATTASFVVLQAISAGLTPAAAAGIAVDYLRPDSPTTTAGAFTGFSPDEGLYTFAAAQSQVAFTPTFSSAVPERWLNVYEITDFTAASLHAVTINGVALRAGTDYVSYVDTSAAVAYVKLLKRLVPGSAGPGQLQAGRIVIG